MIVYQKAQSVEFLIKLGSPVIPPTVDQPEIFFFEAVPDVSLSLNGKGFKFSTLVSGVERTYGLFLSAGALRSTEVFSFPSGTTGATFDVSGAASHFVNGDNSFYVWMRVTDGANTQTDPAINSYGVVVDVLSADNNNQIRDKARDAVRDARTVTNLLGLTQIFNVNNGSFNGPGINIQYHFGARATGSVVGTGLDYNQSSAGANGSGGQPADFSGLDVIYRENLPANETANNLTGGIEYSWQQIWGGIPEFGQVRTGELLTMTMNENGPVADIEDSSVAPSGFDVGVDQQGAFTGPATGGPILGAVIADLTVTKWAPGQTAFEAIATENMTLTEIGGGEYGLGIQDSDTWAVFGEHIMRITGSFDDIEKDIDVVATPINGVNQPDSCIVSGNIVDIGGKPGMGQNIRFGPVDFPVTADQSLITSDRVQTVPDALGNFSVSLIRNQVVVVEIERTGIRNQITVPDQDTALLLDLLPPIS